jgi:signal transduction histidine kinase/DNA-binding NarL/FixJ family response regulator
MTATAACNENLREQLKHATGCKRLDLLNELSLQLCNEDPQVAEAYAQEALTLAQDSACLRGQGVSMMRLGIAVGMQGKFESALAHFDSALTCFEQLDDQRNIALVWNGMAVVYNQQGNYAQALTLWRKAAEAMERLGEHIHLSRLLNNMAILYKLHGDYEIALSVYERTLQLRQAVGEPVAVANTLTNIGNLYRELGDPHLALGHLERAEVILRGSTNKRGWAVTVNNIAWCHVDLGAIDQAEQLLLQTLPIHEALQQFEGMTRALLLLAEVMHARMHYREALDYAYRGLMLAEQAGLKLEARDAHRLLASAHAGAHEFQPAYEHLQEYHHIHRDIFNFQKGLQIAQIRTQYATEVAQKEAEIYRLRTEELSAAKAAAEAANRAKSHFLATMSHELRTPLNAILGYAQLLQQGGAHGKAAQIIEQSGRHLLALINDLLDIAKIEAGKDDLAPTWLRLPPFLRQLSEMAEVWTRDKGITFQLVTDVALPEAVYVDERRLRQVLVNLLVNAVKFTQVGSVTLTIQSTVLDPAPPATPAAASLQFTVSDTGIGIAEEKLATIFEPFEQVSDEHRRSEGAGLGLTISRRLVELMGGALSVQSQAGQGSTFAFAITLPTRDSSPLALSSPRVIGVHGAAPTVLIVDDNAYNRALIVDLLAPLGILTLEAAEGKAALRLLRAYRPSILLTDLVMPGMDGFILIRQLRSDECFQDLVIIAVSASAFPDDEQLSLEIGADVFMRKPIELARLLAVMQQYAGIEWIISTSEAQIPAASINSTAPLPLPVEKLLALLDLANQGDVVALHTCLQQFQGSDNLDLQQLAAELQPLVNSYQIQQLVARLTHLVEKGKSNG